MYACINKYNLFRHVSCRKVLGAFIACMHTRERHHIIIRASVAKRENATSLEDGLAEDLIVESVRQLKAQPMRNGFLDGHPAAPHMMRTLVSHLGCSGRDVQTCASARSGAINFFRGDCAMYSFDGGSTMHAGDIHFFASSAEWGECAFCSAWTPAPGGNASSGHWKFTVLDDLVRVPIDNMYAVAIAHISATSTTVICPPIVMAQ